MFNLLAGEAAKTNSWTTWVIFGVLGVALIGLFAWQSISGKKKKKEEEARINNLKIGDRVKTIGGVCGFLIEINPEENTIVLETGTKDKKSYVKFDRGAIYQTGPANPNAPVKEEKPAEVKEEAAKEEPAAIENKEVIAEKPAEEVKPAKKTKKKAEKQPEEKAE